VKGLLQYDYVAVGHVTVDVLADGTRRPGGSAFYSALQAARLGRHTLILTQGVAREIEQMLDPYRDELELRVLPARHTTTFETSGSGPARSQHLLAWAGPIERELKLDTAILHLAPVAREIPSCWRARGAFVGLTPQGAIRDWSAAGGRVSLVDPPRAAERLAGRCDALVLSRHERAACATLIERARDSGAVVAITAASRPTTLLAGGSESLEVEVPALAEPLEDLGAGDVFAAAFFLALATGGAPASAAAFATAAAAVRMQAVGTEAIGGAAAITARMRSAGRAGLSARARSRSAG